MKSWQESVHDTISGVIGKGLSRFLKTDGSRPQQHEDPTSNSDSHASNPQSRRAQMPQDPKPKYLTKNVKNFTAFHDNAECDPIEVSRCPFSVGSKVEFVSHSLTVILLRSRVRMKTIPSIVKCPPCEVSASRNVFHLGTILPFPYTWSDSSLICHFQNDPSQSRGFRVKRRGKASR